MKASYTTKLGDEIVLQHSGDGVLIEMFDHHTGAWHSHVLNPLDLSWLTMMLEQIQLREEKT